MNIATSFFGSKPSKRNKRNGRRPVTPAMKQQFSLPDSIIYNIIKNPSTPNVYSKMILSCKYFFAKNPILVVARAYKGGRRICSNGETQCKRRHRKCCVNFNVAKISRNTKIWLTNEFYFSVYDIPDSPALFVKKLYRCEEAQLILFNGIINFENFQLYASKFQIYHITCTAITNDDGSNLMLEDVLEAIHVAKVFDYQFSNDILATATTMTSILNLQNLGNLEIFHLSNIPEVIDVADLKEFMKDHINTKFYLCFNYMISEGYMKQLDALIDYIIASKIPHQIISYYGQKQKKLKIMESRYTS